ncbi:LamG-like jellyroll fold domain-containing protein, partial [Kitasatospora sp. NPDC049285]|uniref:LamG-like jellyroll fold domain-containing protein n=1 Tax=Kitasatospora sp. NPDC049285 TaxID=3157096 RepID=UPI0034441A2C
DLLAGKDTVWPLYIDPSYSAGGWGQNWTYVSSAFPTTSYWRTSDATGLRVGYNGWQSPYYVGRAFAQMNVAPQLAGAQISSSTFYATETWSPSCSGRNVELWATGGIGSGTTWNNQPGWSSWQDTKYEAHGYSSSCPTQSVGFNMTGAMQSAVNNGQSDLTLGLKASDEGDSYGWKKFQPSTMTISTTYNHAPTAPGSLSTSPTTACGANPPTVLGNGDVTLYAAVGDPDGGSLAVGFTLKKSDGTVVATSVGSSLAATSGTTTAFVIPRKTLSDAAAGNLTTFSWNVYASDGSADSPVSATCQFVFDSTVPGAPTVTPQTSSYKVGTAASFAIAANATGSAPASFLYQLNGGTPRTAAASSGGATISLEPTRRVNTLTVTAVSPGGNIGDTANLVFNAAAPATALDGDLTGQGRADLAVVGNQAALPSGLWLASGITTNTLSSAADNIGAKGTGVNAPGAATDWNGTQVITGHFATGDGFNDYLAYNPATGAASIVYGNGDGSALSPVSGSQVNVNATAFTGQGSTKATQVANAGALYESASGDPLGIPGLLMVFQNHLVLTGGTGTPGAYAAADASVTLSATNPAGGADWTGWTITTALVNNLPALYARNTTTGELWYYSPTVLTNLAATQILGTNPTPTAPVRVAASGWTSAAKPVLQAADINRDGTADLWSVDSTGNVTARLFDGSTLSPQPLASPVHSWPLNDQSSGAVGNGAARDQVGALPLSGSAAATWRTGDLFTPDVRLDGAAGALTATGPAVNVSGDFSLSVWTQPTSGGGVILSQDGTHSSGLLLYPDLNTRQWFFCLGTADATGWPYDCAHGGTMALGVWSHLTATYNAATGQMVLYVNGVEAATAGHTRVAGTLFRGAFTVGDYLYNDTRTAYYSGRIAQIQTWNQALTPGQVGAAAGSGSAVTLPSDGTLYPSGSTWQLGANTAAFTKGQLTVTIAGTQRFALGSAASPNAVMTLQADGNLVGYPTAADAVSRTNALWATSTSGHANDSLVFQPDGNLVLYAADGPSLWSSQTNTASSDRVLEAVENGALHEVYTDGTGWHDNAVAGVGGNINALAFSYGPVGQRVIEASEGGVLHEIYSDSTGGWHDNAVAGAGSNIVALGFAYGPMGQRVIEASEGGVLHEIYSDSAGYWHDNVVAGVGGNITALGFSYNASGQRVVEAVEGGVLHEIYSDSAGYWHDNAVGGVGGNISAIAFTYNASGQRVIEAVESGVLHEIYTDAAGWHDNPVVGVGGGITALSVRTTATGVRVVEAVEGGVLHEIYTDSAGYWYDGAIAGTAGNATAVSFNLH